MLDEMWKGASNILSTEIEKYVFFFNFCGKKFKGRKGKMG